MFGIQPPQVKKKEVVKDSHRRCKLQEARPAPPRGGWVSFAWRGGSVCCGGVGQFRVERWVSLAWNMQLVVKTEKTDDFGRYVGHVFYSFKDDKLGAVYEHGVYLNEELLHKGFAERM